MTTMRLGLALLLFAVAAPASSQDRSTYESLWEAVAHDPDCAPSQYPDVTLMTCKNAFTLWYFTKPNHAAHPGVVKRAVVQDGPAVSVRLSGWSFASDVAQPAFKTWLAPIQELDRQAKESFERKSRQ